MHDLEISLKLFFVVEMFLVSPQTYSIRNSVLGVGSVGWGCWGDGWGGGARQELSRGRDGG